MFCFATTVVSLSWIFCGFEFVPSYMIDNLSNVGVFVSSVVVEIMINYFVHDGVLRWLVFFSLWCLLCARAYFLCNLVLLRYPSASWRALLLCVCQRRPSPRVIWPSPIGWPFWLGSPVLLRLVWGFRQRFWWFFILGWGQSGYGKLVWPKYRVVRWRLSCPLLWWP